MATILVVDDDPISRLLLTEVLERRGDTVLQAEDGTAALAALRIGASGSIDLVIADALMPRTDGYALVREMRADPALTHVPVILCTAVYQDEASLSLAAASGITQVLAKPIDPKHVLHAVAAALEGTGPNRPSISSSVPSFALSPLSEFDRAHLRLVTDKLVQKVAELENLKDQLFARANRAERLASTLANVGASTDLREALEALLRGVMALIGGTSTTARILDPQTRNYLLFLRLDADGTVSQEPELQAPRPGSYGAQIEAGGTAVLARDYTVLTAEQDPYIAERLANGIRSSVHVPIEAAGSPGSPGRRIGVLHVNHPEPNAFGQEELALAGALALHAGAAIDRARLATAQRAAERAQRAREERVVQRLAHALAEQKQAEAAVLDINSRLRLALAELETTQQQIVQQERLRALGEMASGIAHDFNNALAPVVGFSDLLLSDPATLHDVGKVHEYVALINTAAQDASNIVGRLREFYRQREPNEVFGAVNLPSVIQQAIALTQPKWKNQAQVEGRTIHIETVLLDVAPIEGNEAELRECLTNLIFNAVDAMPLGGTLTLGTRQDGQRVVLEVADTGTGMTEETRRRCLEPFFSTKGMRGTGLGLAMVHGIIQRHGGVLEIDSAPGNGTTIRISLPGLPNVVQTASPSQSVAVSRPLRVLVVDDEPSVRAVTVAYLQHDRHIVLQASNGPDALAALRAGPIDLVICDRAMPGISGDELALAAKRMKPGIPVILLTGFGELTAASEDVPAGVDVVVGKPATLARIRDALAQAVSPG
jgi:signal transduction histidine kinase/response regulator RpfG family c-di-GMP phosphodiesterase